MADSWTQFFARILRFPSKTPKQRFESFYYRWKKLFPTRPFPIHLPNGDWWLLDLDFIGQCILQGGYENAECEFCSRLLQPGMTVLDIGAHQGLLSLLFSHCVGSKGRVLSFEPFAKNISRLRLHLWMNLRTNVDVIQCALGNEERVAPLYVVPSNPVLNSLHPPDTELSTTSTDVKIRKLDDILAERKVDRVDFIKLDVEGGELSVLKGASALLRRTPRPVFLCEVLDQRTRPWGYSGLDIISYLRDRDFSWFALDEQSQLSPLSPSVVSFAGNFVAVPSESISLLDRLSIRDCRGRPKQLQPE